MTAPKQHLPNQIVHLVRRTNQRQFLLRNDATGLSKNAAGYIYVLAAKKHGQLPHAVMTMSNHIHMCQTDTTGYRSKFMQEFHGLYAKVLNRAHQRQDSVWSGSEPGNMLLLDTKAVIDQMVYVWLNPVRAGLVERVVHWDHFKILPSDWGKVIRFKRPDYFRDGDPNKPEYLEMIAQPPAPLAHIPIDELVAYLEKRIAAEEEACMVARRKKNKKVIGMVQCYTLKPTSTPDTKAARCTRNPRFSSSKPELIVNAIEGLKAFWSHYKRCLEALKKGSRDSFPAGTIKLPGLLGLACSDLDKYPHLKIEYEPFQMT